MESILDLGSLVLEPFAEMSDAQVTSCGRWFLAAATSYYVALALKKPIAADTKQAIEGHLPQGFDRSMIDARLQQRRNKELMMHTLQLSERREELRRATSREAKLRGWNDVFRLTLVAIISACYVHSLTLCLFAMKNTIRVLVFLMRQRDEARAPKRGGALGRVKAWWSGGTRSLMTDLMMEQMARSLQTRASPFATIGVGEEIPLPVPPVAPESHSGLIAPHTSPVTLSFPIVSSTPSALQQLHAMHSLPSPHAHPPTSHATTSETAKEDDRRVVVTAAAAETVLPQTLHKSPQQQMEEERQQRYWEMKQFRAQMQALEAASAMAEQSFSVRVVLETAVPAIVQCAARVVDYALHQRPAHAFAAAGIATASDMRALWMEMAEHMEHEACIAEWVRAVVVAPPRLLVSSPEHMRDVVSPDESDYREWGIPRRSRRTAKDGPVELMNEEDGGGDERSRHAIDAAKAVQTGRNIVSSNTSKANTPNSKEAAVAHTGEVINGAPPVRRQRRPRLPIARVPTSSSSSSSSSASSDSDDVVRLPPGRSTLMFGADGRPVQVMEGSQPDGGVKSELNALNDFAAQFDNPMEDDDEEDDMGYDGSTSEERVSRAEALRREQLIKEQSANFFQELIRSASFAELSLTYAAELLHDVIDAASDLSTVKSYDAASDSAKMLMIIAGLDQHRQQMFDAEFEVKPYIRLFCEEMVRSTCS